MMEIKRDNEAKREELYEEYDVYHSPGDGWLHLTEAFCEELENIVDNYNDHWKDDNDPEIEFPDTIMLKEKYGGLDINTGAIHEDIADRVFALTSFIRRISQKVCESCGSPQNVTHTPVQSWRKTICKSCIGEEAYNELESNNDEES